MERIFVFLHNISYCIFVRSNNVAYTITFTK